jgi:hypothetical protein
MSRFLSREISAAAGLLKEVVFVGHGLYVSWPYNAACRGPVAVMSRR